MLNMFGRDYEEIGNSSKGLILKNSGKVKIQWGKTFIDLLDSNGNLNVKLQSLIKTVSSKSDIKQDGFYFYNQSLYAKIGDKIVLLSSEGTESLYVSFLEEQKTSDEQKYIALKNIGFIYPTQNEQNIYPKNGIVYIEDTQSLFIVNDGVLTKYQLSIPTPYTQQFIISKEDDSKGSLVIQGEGIENGLIFNTLRIYSSGIRSIFDADSEFNFNIDNTQQFKIKQGGIMTNSISSFNSDSNQGYSIREENGEYVLNIDRINIRHPEEIESIKYKQLSHYYNKENIIINTNYEYTDSEETQISKYIFNLKYINEYQVDDELRSYVELSSQLIPVKIIVTEVTTNSISATEIVNLSTQEPIISINNAHCFLIARGSSNNRIENLDLVIGEIDHRYKPSNKYGIISKQNIFYSTKFEKEGTGSEIFPFYSSNLTTELTSTPEGSEIANYDNNLYRNVIPPIQVVKLIADAISKKNLGQLLTALNIWNTLPSQDSYLHYNGETFEWENMQDIQLGELLTALNEESMPTQEGYLHYNNGQFDWQMSSDSKVLDVFDTLTLSNKDSELEIVSPTSAIIQTKANSGEQEVEINSSTVWYVSNNILFQQDLRREGNNTFEILHKNYSTNQITSTIVIKDMFYDRLEELYPDDSVLLAKHKKTISYIQAGKKSLQVRGGNPTYSYNNTSQNQLVINSSFDVVNFNYSDIDWIVTNPVYNAEQETLTFYIQFESENTSSQDKVGRILITTEDTTQGENQLIITVTQEAR